jgi:hypothetical protein
LIIIFDFGRLALRQLPILNSVTAYQINKYIFFINIESLKFLPKLCQKFFLGSRVFYIILKNFVRNFSVIKRNNVDMSNDKNVKNIFTENHIFIEEKIMNKELIRPLSLLCKDRMMG